MSAREYTAHDERMAELQPQELTIRAPKMMTEDETIYDMSQELAQRRAQLVALVKELQSLADGASALADETQAKHDYHASRLDVGRGFAYDHAARLVAELLN